MALLTNNPWAMIFVFFCLLPGIIFGLGFMWGRYTARHGRPRVRLHWDGGEPYDE